MSWIWTVRKVPHNKYKRPPSSRYASSRPKTKVSAHEKILITVKAYRDILKEPKKAAKWTQLLKADRVTLTFSTLARAAKVHSHFSAINRKAGLLRAGITRSIAWRCKNNIPSYLHPSPPRNMRQKLCSYRSRRTSVDWSQSYCRRPRLGRWRWLTNAGISTTKTKPRKMFIHYTTAKSFNI